YRRPSPRSKCESFSGLTCDNCRVYLLQMSHLKPNTDPLTRREREIMNAVFAMGNQASAEEIRARLTDPPGDSAVRVMLTRLEKKGYLKHQQDGLRYLYSATTSPMVAKRNALQQYVHTFFGGSMKQMMTAMVAEGSWSDDDLDALKAEIERVR